MHLAAQYLATAAISFILKKNDDSHTNLGWRNHTLLTHPFPNGDALGLNYENFSLEWITQNGNKEHFLLDGKTHQDIISWISKTSSVYIVEVPYNYNLHYDLPYEEINTETRFELANPEALNALIKQRDVAQRVISQILKSNALHSSVRIWPHHFDTGAFTIVNDKLAIGIGLAIPDTLIDDFYFYISGYNGHDAVALDFNDNTPHEDYYSNGWKGFAKPLSELNEESAIAFCQMAIDTYINSVK